MRPPNHSGMGVFPACAGMFRARPLLARSSRGFPRMRGDVPPIELFSRVQSAFSPHARGCSYRISVRKFRVRVFPACAGMFLPENRRRPGSQRFPRMRGDVPGSGIRLWRVPGFSPHARGCSDTIRDLRLALRVFPACAGMFRCYTGNLILNSGFPRMRGDVPGAQ